MTSNLYVWCIHWQDQVRGGGWWYVSSSKTTWNVELEVLFSAYSVSAAESLQFRAMLGRLTLFKWWMSCAQRKTSSVQHNSSLLWQFCSKTTFSWKICIYKLSCIIIFCFSMLFFSRGMSVRIGCGYVCTVHLRIFMHQSISVWCEWDLPGRHIRDNKGFWMFSWFYICIRKGVLFWQIKTNKSLDNECPVLIL